MGVPDVISPEVFRESRGPQSGTDDLGPERVTVMALRLFRISGSPCWDRGADARDQRPAPRIATGDRDSPLPGVSFSGPATYSLVRHRSQEPGTKSGGDDNTY